MDTNTQRSELRAQDQRIQSIRALYEPNFRLFWFGLVVSHVGSWVQTIGQGCLVYQLTHSPFYLGLVGFSSTAPQLFFLLLGGAMADRVDRRRFIAFTQCIFMLNALLLGMLVALHWVKIWHVIAMSLISGTVMSFDAPARQSFVQDLVGDEDLMNAVALNSAVFNAARIFGPALAAVLVAATGIASCFFINSASFLAVIIALFFVDLGPDRKAAPETNIWADMAEGLNYLRQNSTIRMLVLMAAVPAIFAMPYTNLMPAVAHEVFHAGPKGYATLMSAVGLGALTGALGLAVLSNYPHRGKLLLSAAMLGSVALVLFTFSKTYWVGVMILPLVGMALTTYAATTNTTLQMISPPEMRGRMLSAYMVAFSGMAPIGNLQMGTLAGLLGVDTALRIGGIAVGVATLAIAFCRRDIRHLRI